MADLTMNNNEPPHVTRMRTEHYELQAKMDSLTNFTHTTQYLGLPMEERIFMDIQLGHMLSYARALQNRIRITRWDNPPPPAPMPAPIVDTSLPFEPDVDFIADIPHEVTLPVRKSVDLRLAEIPWNRSQGYVWVYRVEGAGTIQYWQAKNKWQIGKGKVRHGTVGTLMNEIEWYVSEHGSK